MNIHERQERQIPMVVIYSNRLSVLDFLRLLIFWLSYRNGILFEALKL